VVVVVQVVVVVAVSVVVVVVDTVCVVAVTVLVAKVRVVLVVVVAWVVAIEVIVVLVPEDNVTGVVVVLVDVVETVVMVDVVVAVGVDVVVVVAVRVVVEVVVGAGQHMNRFPTQLALPSEHHAGPSSPPGFTSFLHGLFVEHAPRLATSSHPLNADSKLQQKGAWLAHSAARASSNSPSTPTGLHMYSTPSYFLDSFGLGPPLANSAMWHGRNWVVLVLLVLVSSSPNKSPEPELAFSSSAQACRTHVAVIAMLMRKHTCVQRVAAVMPLRIFTLIQRRAFFQHTCARPSGA
jgi:hypothetical protein